MAVVNVKSEIAGNVWKIQLKPGDKVEADGEIMILESMKMELPALSTKEVLKPGLEFAGRTLLRIGVALYGAQLTLGQLVDGGPLPVIIAIAAVSCTIAFGAVAARMMGLTRDFGLLTGCATGVCGA